MPIRRAVLVDDDHAVARGLEQAHDLRVAAEHPLVLDGRHERRVHVDQRRAEAPGHLDQHALVGGHRAAGDEQPGEVLVAQAVVVAEAAGAEHDAAARADAPVVGGGDADDLAGLVGQHALDGMARADVDAALTGRGLHAPGELDPVARLPVGQLRDDDTAEGHLVDLVVAVVVGVVVGVHDRQGADVDQRLHRGRAVVDERRQQLVLPGRKAERRVLRVVHRRPREPRQVGHRVLARVGDALLLHEVVVGDPGPCGSLAPVPPTSSADSSRMVDAPSSAAFTAVLNPATDAPTTTTSASPSHSVPIAVLPSRIPSPTLDRRRAAGLTRSARRLRCCAQSRGGWCRTGTLPRGGAWGPRGCR